MKLISTVDENESFYVADDLDFEGHFEVELDTYGSFSNVYLNETQLALLYKHIGEVLKANEVSSSDKHNN